MVILFREKISPQADTIEAEFKVMMLGYDRIILDPAEAAARFGPEHSLPDYEQCQDCQRRGDHSLYQ